MSSSFALRLHKGDQMAGMASMGEAGQPCDVFLPDGKKPVQLVEAVPFGHKVAIESIEMDHRYESPRRRQPCAHAQPVRTALRRRGEHAMNATFPGYERAHDNGGIRNKVLLLPG